MATVRPGHVLSKADRIKNIALSECMNQIEDLGIEFSDKVKEVRTTRALVKDFTTVVRDGAWTILNAFDNDDNYQELTPSVQSRLHAAVISMGNAMGLYAVYGSSRNMKDLLGGDKDKYVAAKLMVPVTEELDRAYFILGLSQLVREQAAKKKETVGGGYSSGARDYEGSSEVPERMVRRILKAIFQDSRVSLDMFISEMLSTTSEIQYSLASCFSGWKGEKTYDLLYKMYKAKLNTRKGAGDRLKIYQQRMEWCREHKEEQQDQRHKLYLKRRAVREEDRKERAVNIMQYKSGIYQVMGVVNSLMGILKQWTQQMTEKTTVWAKFMETRNTAERASDATKKEIAAEFAQFVTEMEDRLVEGIEQVIYDAGETPKEIREGVKLHLNIKDMSTASSDPNSISPLTLTLPKFMSLKCFLQQQVFPEYALLTLGGADGLNYLSKLAKIEYEHDWATDKVVSALRKALAGHKKGTLSIAENSITNASLYWGEEYLHKLVVVNNANVSINSSITEMTKSVSKETWEKVKKSKEAVMMRIKDKAGNEGPKGPVRMDGKPDSGDEQDTGPEVEPEVETETLYGNYSLQDAMNGLGQMMQENGAHLM